MTRTIPASLAGVLEQLELQQPTLVTFRQLAELLAESGVQTSVAVAAARLREKGWLLRTGQRGVWEFAPAAMAGPYSRHDPVREFAAYVLQHPGSPCGLTFQAAAWAHGDADRVPAHLEVAAGDSLVARQLPSSLRTTVFNPNLAMAIRHDVPVLERASVLVHMAARPSAVRSWQSALEWLPQLAAEIDPSDIHTELDGRPTTVAARTGYLLQGLRPDIAETVAHDWPSRTAAWFGPRGSSRRYDSRWMLTDTLLPFDPRDLNAVA